MSELDIAVRPRQTLGITVRGRRVIATIGESQAEGNSTLVIPSNVVVRPRTLISITVRARKSFAPVVDGMVIGDPGLSAYEVAVKNGFVGTEDEWLEYISQTHDHDVGDLVQLFQNSLV